MNRGGGRQRTRGVLPSSGAPRTVAGARALGFVALLSLVLAVPSSRVSAEEPAVPAMNVGDDGRIGAFVVAGPYEPRDRGKGSPPEKLTLDDRPEGMPREAPLAGFVCAATAPEPCARRSSVEVTKGGTIDLRDRLRPRGEALGLALLGFLVWGHHMFVAGMSEYSTMVFSALTFLVAIPSGVKIFNWVATLYKGSISLQSPMLWALSFIFLFTIGGLTGLFLGTLAVDVHLHDTYFVVAHFHYVMVGGTVMGFVGGLHYWWPKITGKLYEEKPAIAGWALVFIGFNVTFMSQFVLGSRGMPRRYYDYLPEFEPLHKVSTMGSWILGLGFLILLYNFVQSLLNGKKSPRNPWGSAALEWQTATPPPLYNFVKTPVITRGPYEYHLATDEELSED